MEEIEQKDSQGSKEDVLIGELEERAYDARTDAMGDLAEGWHEEASKKRHDEEALLMAAKQLEDGDSIEEVGERFAMILDVLRREDSDD